MVFAGRGDLPGLLDKMESIVPADQQSELVAKLAEGAFTLRLMYEQFQNLLKMGPMGQVFTMLTSDLTFIRFFFCDSIA